MANKRTVPEPTIYQCSGELELPNFTNQFPGKRSQRKNQLQLNRKPLTVPMTPRAAFREVRIIDRSLHLPGFSRRS